MSKYIVISLLAMILATSSFADKADKKRAKINKMKAEVLTQLYAEEPKTRKQIKKAKGYAVFSNVGINVIFFSAGGGRGVAHDNKTGKDIYMKMASAGIGIGMGIKDFRAVFIFHTDDAFNKFVDYGWDFSGQADAAAKSDDKGAEGSQVANLANGVSVYQLTKSGLALQATLQGTKYWKDKKLN